MAKITTPKTEQNADTTSIALPEPNEGLVRNTKETAHLFQPQHTLALTPKIRCILPQCFVAVNEVWYVDSLMLGNAHFPGQADAQQVWLTSFIDARSLVMTGGMLTRGRPTTMDVLCALRNAIRKFGKPATIVTDNGSVFCSEAFKRALIKLNIIHKRTTPYCPAQNGKIERIFATINREFLAIFNFLTIKTTDGLPGRRVFLCWGMLLQCFEDWMADYNAKRRHSALGGKVPLDVFAQNADGRITRVSDADSDRFVVMEHRVRVERQGVSLKKGRYWQCAGFLGLVGKMVTVTHPPEGFVQPILAYRNGKPLGQCFAPEEPMTLAPMLKAANEGIAAKLKALIEGVELDPMEHRRTVARIQRRYRAAKRHSNPGAGCRVSGIGAADSFHGPIYVWY